MNDKATCHSCHKELDLELGAKVMKSEECPYCYASVRCCKMCTFYDSKSYNNCREPSADRIVEKEKSNFCDFFVLNTPGPDKESQESPISAANALFKN